MNKQEINYFLDGVTAKQDLIESIEGLRSELRTAMQPMMKPVYKDNDCRAHWILEEMSHIYESDLNLYEKAVFLYLLNFDESWPQSTNDIASATGMSKSSVKRVIAKGLEYEQIMKHPYEPGYLLTKHYKA